MYTASIWAKYAIAIVSGLKVISWQSVGIESTPLPSDMESTKKSGTDKVKEANFYFAFYKF